jgi:hypothetical protein
MARFNREALVGVITTKNCIKKNNVIAEPLVVFSPTRRT